MICSCATHLVLAPIVIGIINNHKFERLPMPVMVEAEVVGRRSHHAKTTMAAVVAIFRRIVGVAELSPFSTLPVQGPAFFRRPNKTIISRFLGLL